jgi:hypothetical protein
VQLTLAEALNEIKFLKSRIEVQERNYQTQIDEVKSLQAHNNKLTADLVALQQKYAADMQQLRTEHEENVKLVRKMERLNFKAEMLKHS